jgi:hypothetical protein
LSWTNHTQHVCLKLNKALYLIKSLRDSVSLRVLKNVYFTKFDSMLKYGIIFWGGGLKTPKQFLKYKKCLRVIMGINNCASCISLFREFEILIVTSLHIFGILYFIVKNRIYTTQYSEVHGYDTVYKHNLYAHYCKTNHCKRSVIKLGTQIFNSLPLELKGDTDFKVFKRKLKGYLLHSAFYSLQEFL